MAGRHRVSSEVLMDFFEAFPRLSGQPRLVDLRRFCEEAPRLELRRFGQL